MNFFSVLLCGKFTPNVCLSALDMPCIHTYKQYGGQCPLPKTFHVYNISQAGLTPIFQLADCYTNIVLILR